MTTLTPEWRRWIIDTSREACGVHFETIKDAELRDKLIEKVWHHFDVYTLRGADFSVIERAIQDYIEAIIAAGATVEPAEQVFARLKAQWEKQEGRTEP